VNTANPENEHLVCLGARVEPELAEAVRALASAGDRSVSKQIRRALLEHVEHLPDSSFSGSAQRTAAAASDTVAVRDGEEG
jgi:hypothetical protein